jgi:hypothetical protein
MILQTLHDIEAGEELTISRLEKVHYKQATSRALELLARFGITCTGAACDISSSIFTEHEKSRDILDGGMNYLHRQTAHIPDDLDNPSANIPLDDLEVWEVFGENILGDLQNLKRSVGWEVVACLEVLVCKVLPHLADYMEDKKKKEKWGVMKKEAAHAVKAAKVCWGEDSEEYRV